MLEFPYTHPGRHLQKLAVQEAVEYIKKKMDRAIPLPTARHVLENAISEARIDGHFIEFGVYKGGTIKFIAQTVPNRQIHGFDSFHGLSEQWSGNRSMFDAKGKLPKVPGNVTLHKGLFSDSLPGWLSRYQGPVSLIHIDCDLYSSAKSIFDLLGQRIVPGTIIVFDEYFNYHNWQQHEFKAFQEFVHSRKVKYEYICFARIQVAVKITEIQ